MTQELELFKSKKLRVEVRRGEPYFCLQDVCREVGLEETQTVLHRLRQTDVFLTNSGIVTTIDTETETGRRAMAYVNELGLYQILSNSRKQKAKEFFSQVVIALPGLRQDNQRLAVLEKKVEELSRGGKHLISTYVPRTPPSISLRTKLNIVIRDFVHRQTTDYGHQEAWSELYRQFRDRHHIDLKAKARNATLKMDRIVTPLDYAESEGFLPDLYDLAVYIFRPLDEA